MRLIDFDRSFVSLPSWSSFGPDLPFNQDQDQDQGERERKMSTGIGMETKTKSESEMEMGMGMESEAKTTTKTCLSLVEEREYLRGMMMVGPEWWEDALKSYGHDVVV